MAEPENKPTKITNRNELAPELLAAIEADASSAERARLAALDAMNVAGLEEIIAKAKADGSQPEAIAMECFKVTRAQVEASDKKQALARDAAQAGGLRPGDAPPNPVPVDPKRQAAQHATKLIVNAFKEARPNGVPARVNGN